MQFVAQPSDPIGQAEVFFCSTNGPGELFFVSAKGQGVLLITHGQGKVFFCSTKGARVPWQQGRGQ